MVHKYEWATILLLSGPTRRGTLSLVARRSVPAASTAMPSVSRCACKPWDRPITVTDLSLPRSHTCSNAGPCTLAAAAADLREQHERPLSCGCSAGLHCPGVRCHAPRALAPIPSPHETVGAPAGTRLRLAVAAADMDGRPVSRTKTIFIGSTICEKPARTSSSSASSRSSVRCTKSICKESTG